VTLAETDLELLSCRWQLNQVRQLSTHDNGTHVFESGWRSSSLRRSLVVSDQLGQQFQKNFSTLRVEKTEMENMIESLQEKVVELRQQHANDKAKINNMGLQLQALRLRQQERVFTLFRKLLKELRLLVREIILNTPQIVSAR
jgi:Skp family chaperone for outer membrane proteins